jgi:hypothetical protein
MQSGESRMQCNPSIQAHYGMVVCLRVEGCARLAWLGFCNYVVFCIFTVSEGRFGHGIRGFCIVVCGMWLLAYNMRSYS